MATFFIGCRVRIARGVWKGAGENPIGCEGRIANANVTDLTGSPFEWGVQLDNGRMIAANSFHLEPTIPEGHQKVDIETILSIPGLDQLERILRPDKVPGK